MPASTVESLLRIFVGESDRAHGQPLYEWLVLEAKARGLAGATVLRGIMSYGATSHLHTFKIERLSLDLPVVVEIVDTREKVEAFLDGVAPSLSEFEGIATVERVDVRRFGQHAAQGRG
jgi:PII-like signaling protein